jgi:hypothetical protein
VLLLEKTYIAETIADLEEDILYAIENIDSPVDEHGFFEGEVYVYVEFKENFKQHNNV